MESQRHLRLSLVCLASSFVPSSMALVTALDAASSLNLLPKRDQLECANQEGLQACPADIDFCCPTSTTCIPTTADKSSVICCPKGTDCKYINRIDCNVDYQNATANPGAPYHSTRLDQALPQCGEMCCPFGYECQNGQCFFFGTTKTNNNMANNGTAPASSSVQTVPNPTNTPLENSTEPTPMPVSNGPAYPAKAVILGLFLGILVGIGLLLLALFLLKRRKNKEKPVKPGESPDFMQRTPSPTGHSYNHSGSQNTISEPVSAPQYGQSHRTDFLLRRGETETSYEQSVKPSWSSVQDASERGIAMPSRAQSSSTKSSAPERGRIGGSFLSRLTEGSTLNDPVTPASQMSTRHERMAPLFAKPLKFGQQLTPAKSLRSTRKGPPRPLRTDDGSSTLSAGSSRRDDSQQRPLVLKVDKEMRPNSLTRSSSCASINSSHQRRPRTPPQHPSEEITTFLGLPLGISSSDKELESRISNVTTIDQMMKKFGLEKSESGSYTPTRS